MKLIRRLLVTNGVITFRAGLVLGALIALLWAAVPASAARLEAGARWISVDPSQPWLGHVEHFVTYAAAPGEVNRLVVGGAGGDLIALYDPGIPMTPASGALPTANPDGALNGGFPLNAAWYCASPTAKSVGVCVSTYGTSDCNEGGCSEGSGFDRIEISLGDLGDSVTLEKGSLSALVYTGSGDDKIDSRNQRRDSIVCGAGLDTVAADGLDSVSADCETVTRGLGLLK
jgi:hypothetical protein